MKPQTGLFLDKAGQQLQRADAMLGIGLHDDAGRAAYLAGLPAAQALIFEITDRARKRHSGVQREFARLVKDDRVSTVSYGRFCRRPTISKPLPTMNRLCSNERRKCAQRDSNRARVRGLRHGPHSAGRP